MSLRARARLRPAWCLLAAWVCVACAVTPDVSVEGLRRRAAEERPQAPASPVQRPACVPEPRPADPALAPKTIDQVAAAIAPLRGSAEPEPEAAPGPSVLAARERARAGDLESAVRGLAEHLRQTPGDLQAWREIARMLDAAGRRDVANEAWGRVLAVRPLDAEALSSGGVDAAAARQPLLAAERLLRLRQMQRVGEVPQPDPREAIGQSVALGLALREVGHLRAAAQALGEAAAASVAFSGPEASAMRRQAPDLLRLEGECEMAVGDAQAASEAFRAALADSPPEDRVALPRLVWSLRAAGRSQAAMLAVAEAAWQPRAAGRAGLPQAAELIEPLQSDAAVVGPLGPASEPFDGVRARARLAMGDAAMVEALLAHGLDRVDFTPALAFVAQRQGLSVALDRACGCCETRLDRAAELAAALRCLPAAPSALRAGLETRSRKSDAARLLRARMELLGGDAAEAMRVADQPAAGVELSEALHAARAEAAGALEHLEQVTACAAAPVQGAPLAASLAIAFAATGSRVESERWAERAIDIDPKCAWSWIARARADLVGAGAGESPQQAEPALAQARLSAERAWDADPAGFAGARLLLELLKPDAPQRAEVREQMRAAPVDAAPLRELDRAEAIRRVQAGQAEPAIGALRALLLEDPLDGECARMLVVACGTCGRLPEVEAWLDDLRVRRPAAPALLEAVITAKARQGRLTEGVQALREAAQAEPESWARRVGWARGLSIAGRHAEAWSVMAGEPVSGSPRERLERAEFALRDGREALAAELLASVSKGVALTDAQRLGALGIALRLRADTPGRRELAAALGRAALLAPEAGPAALSAAMMEGTDDEARALASKWARAWSALAACESAQRLIDERLAGRAAMLLAEAAARAGGEDRRQLLRAEIAVLASIGDDITALRRLREGRSRLAGALLLDDSAGLESDDVTELAGAFLLAGRTEAAQRLYEQALQLAPEAGEPLNNLAWLRLGSVGPDPRTDELVQRALTARPDEPSTLDTAGWWNYRRGGDLELAVAQLRKATSGENPSLESLDHLGDALWAAGRGTDAQSTWRLVTEGATGRASRSSVMQAFDRMQQRRWGVRAWDAASFYDARDGAAIRRAQAKLKALAEGGQPPIEPRQPAAAAAASESPAHASSSDVPPAPDHPNTP